MDVNLKFVSLLLIQKEHGVKGKSKMKISVSPHGLKLFDAASMVPTLSESFFDN